MTEQPIDGEAIGGVSLAQFAGVTAAIDSKLPLSNVLAQEQIDPSVWQVAEKSWKEAIADRPELHLAYLRKRREAEDCLAGSIEPIDSDPAAWAGLLGAIATASDPSTLLGALGISMNDVGRIGRKWKARAESDAELGKRLAELAGSASPPARVTSRPAELRPFPWTPAPKEAPVVAVASTKFALEETVADSDATPAQEAPRLLATFQIREQARHRPTLASETLRSATPVAPPSTRCAGTTEVDPEKIRQAAAARGIPFPQPVPVATGTAPLPTDELLERRPRPRGAETIGTAPAMKQTLPFARASNAGRLTRLDQYAQLAAELRAIPEEADRILAKFGLRCAAERQDVHVYWRLKFENSPGLRRAFEKIVEETVNAIRKERGVV